MICTGPSQTQSVADRVKILTGSFPDDAHLKVSVAPRPFRLFVRGLGSTVRRVIFCKGAHNGRPFGRHKTTVAAYRGVYWRRSKALAGGFEGTDCRGKLRAGRDCHRCRPPPWLPAPAGA